MLRAVQPGRRDPGGHFAIIAARYNARYVDALLQGARRELTAAKADSIRVIRVPGSFEIPAVAARLARTRTPELSAILCFGVILRGETTHAQHIAESVSHALARIQVTFELPVIHGVYLFENREQARVRCLGKTHNRGIECARVALEMAAVMRELGPRPPDREYRRFK
jgi:6,7-dimethyl-8-ribityllumazine synthase